MVLTEFLQNLTSQNLLTLARQATTAPQTIVGGTVVETGTATTFLERIPTLISEQQLLTSVRTQQGIQKALAGLGEASLDISSALNEQITIREQQIDRINESLRNQQIFTTSVQEQTTKGLADITTAISDVGKGGFDPLQFIQDQPLLSGIGVGGLAVGAVILLLLLRR